MDIPEFKEELERKTFETLDWIHNGWQKGLLSQEQASAAADAVFMVTSGLVSRQLMEMVTAIGIHVGNDTPKRRRVFFKDGVAVIASWVVGDTDIGLIGLSKGNRAEGARSNATAAEARDTFNAIHKSFTKEGYVEV